MFKESTSSTSVQVLQKCVPSIIINSDALTKMLLYVEECDDEIGWLGTAYRNAEKNIIYIDDVFLFEQEVHSTTTEISPEGLSEFGEKLLQKDNEKGIEIWNNLKVWGHSHTNMTISPSNQDDKQMETFADNGHDWFVRIIANKKEELRVDLYYYNQGIIYNNLPWATSVTKEEKEIEKKIKELYEKLETFHEARIEKFKEDITKEMKEKIKKKTYAQHNNYGVWGYGTTYGNYYNQPVKKNSTEEKTKENKVENQSLEIQEDITELVDVFTFFTEEELFEIGSCLDLDDVKEHIQMNGQNPMGYTRRELVLIWSAGREIYYGIPGCNFNYE